MGKLALLREYLKLMVSEVADASSRAPFQLTAPAAPGKKGRYGASYFIYREFPMVPTPEMMQQLKLTDSDLEEGLLYGEQEIGIDLTDVYHEKEERRTWNHPGNPESFLIEGWDVVSLNGMQLSPQDASALKDYLGELTDEEQDALIEQYIENLPEPDYDDGGYDPYY